MAFSAVPLVATGDLWTAANQNTYLRDNWAASWVGTTAGDLNYYTGAAAKSRLAIGGQGSLLRSTGTAPSWLASAAAGAILRMGAANPTWLLGGSNGQVLTMAAGLPAWSAGGVVIGSFSHAAEQTKNVMAEADIPNATVTIAPVLTSTIIFYSNFSCAHVGGAFSSSFYAYINGVNTGVVSITGDNVYEAGGVLGVATGVAAGNRICKLRWANGGNTTYIKYIYAFVLAFPE